MADAATIVRVERDWSRLLKYSLASWFFGLIAVQDSFAEAASLQDTLYVAAVAPLGFVLIGAFIAMLKIAWAHNKTSIRFPWQAQSKLVGLLSVMLAIGAIIAAVWDYKFSAGVMALLPFKIMLWPPTGASS